MNITEIRKKCSELHSVISSGRLNNAIVAIHEAAKETLCPIISERLEDITFAYNTLLDYYIGGADDPQRNMVLYSITEKLHELSDDWADNVMLAQCPNSFKAKALNAASKKDLYEIVERYYAAYKEDELAKFAEPSLAATNVKSTPISEEMFDYIWSAKSSNEITQIIRNFVSDESVPEQIRELMVGALTLSMAHRFSSSNTALLIELSHSNTQRIAARAMVGLLMTIIVHTKRLFNNVRLKAQLDALLDDVKMRTFLFEVFLTIERSRVARTIEDKMKNEITPEIIKARNVVSDNEMDVIMPNDLEELFSKSPKLKNSIDQLSQWQMEGADVFLPTFRHLKDFSFFSHLCNWLLPFYESQPMLAEAIKNETDNLKNSLLSRISKTNSMCDSDKYSILLSFPQVPAQSKEDMSRVYNQELEQNDEIFNDNSNGIQWKQIVANANQFVQDLYRLFCIHPRRREFPDIFMNVPTFHLTEIFKTLLSDDKYYELLGEFYIKHSLFDDAKQMYDLLLAKNPTDIETLRKSAYCRLMNDEINEALDLLQRADLADDTNVWTKRKIALCMQRQKKYNSALFYLQQAEKLSDNNMSIKFAIGNCLLELGQTSNALKYYFEVEYNQPSNLAVVRPIVWCSFIENKFEQADNYINKIGRDVFTNRDFMVLGHLRLCQGHRKEAIAAYRSSLAKYNSCDQFIREMQNDCIYLEHNGIAHEDIPIIIDAIIRGIN